MGIGAGFYHLSVFVNDIGEPAPTKFNDLALLGRNQKLTRSRLGLTSAS